MTTLEAIREKLAADLPLAALVGTRIYPQVIKQGAATPAVVLTVVSEVPQNTFTGAPGSLLLSARVQVDAYAATYREAHAVADAVDAVIGALSSPSLSAYRDNKQDLYDDETQQHRVSLDFSVWR